MNKVDRQYLDLVQDILEHGTRKMTRAGEVLSVFDRTMRFDLKEGLPLLTTKKVYTKGVIHELLWFLKGDTNIKYLVENNVNIWTDDAYRYYKELVAKHNKNVDVELKRDFYKIGPIKPVVSKEEFVEKVLHQDKELFVLNQAHYLMSMIPNSYCMDYTYGDLGYIYGAKWRGKGGKTDQVAQIIETLKNNPDDRRMLCVSFDNDIINSDYGVALPPCHVMWQVYTRELREDERMRLVPKEELAKARDDWSKRLDELEIPKRELSLMFVARSQDEALGTPYNCASYGIATYMLCELVNMVPGELIYHGEDCHIYLNQLEGIKEQLTRKGSETLPTLRFTEGKQFNDISDFTYEDFIIEGYNPDPVIKMPLSVG